MIAFLNDVRYALRLFAKSPAFAAVAVLTLAIGIGANTAIFSVADALLLRPLPYAQPDRLVLIFATQRLNKERQGPLSWLRFQQVNEQSRSFTAVAAFTTEAFTLTGRGDPEQFRGARVSWNFFDILGVQPALGRTFTPEEDKPGGDQVALISHALWARRFGSDPGAMGTHITLDSKEYTIAGVLPADFRFDFFGTECDIVTPRVYDLNIATPQQVQAGAGFLNYVARLRPGVSLGRAQAEMDALSARYRAAFPRNPDSDPGLIVQVGNLRDEMVSSVRPAVLILFGAVSVVLLIACANVASLLLSRALGRRREIAVRTAIGAPRFSLVRQLLTESLLLALAGGALGALLSAWGTRLIAALAQGSLPRAQDIRTDGSVLLFTAAVSVIAGVLFGLAPALQISRPDLISVLRSEGRSATSGRSRSRMRNLLVVSQVALSMLLLIGAGLLIRNFVQLRAASPGFDSHGLLTMNISLPPARYDKSHQVLFFDDLLRRVRGVAGVRSAAVDSALPLNASRFSPALPEGQPLVPLAERPLFAIHTMTAGYVETMRLPLESGRAFTERDGEHDPKVILVNEAAARRYWPGLNAVGKHILVGRMPQPIEIVGVLSDVRNINLAADPQPEIYLPYAQLPTTSMNLVVRTAGDPRLFVNAIRSQVFEADRGQPVTAIRTMDEVLEAGAAQPRFTTALLGGLSLTALILAIVGIYGVIAYSVGERVQEMGIRMALGARRGDILRLVLRQGLMLAAIGIAIGLGAALALTHLLSSLLYRVSVTDPLTFAAGAALFTAVALAASYIPARRATRVDPVVALRGE
jgi:putative ABC transport system permease protein